MSITYFKRYRMEISLARSLNPNARLPHNFSFVSWEPDLLETHAEVKFRSFQSEVDSYVFPCLGDGDGCLKLMDEIRSKDGFLPAATWLLAHDDEFGSREYCGTIQGISDSDGFGGVQNVGVTPEYRGRGLGTCLIHQALMGFRRSGLGRAYLEVTARNKSAVRLYRRLGFRKVRTSYKAVEAVYA